MRLVDQIRVDPECSPPPNSGEAVVQHDLSEIPEHHLPSVMNACTLEALSCIAIPADRLLMDDLLSGSMSGAVFAGPQARNVIAAWLREVPTDGPIAIGYDAALHALIVGDVRIVQSSQMSPFVAFYIPSDAGLTAQNVNHQAIRINGLHATGSSVRRYTLNRFIHYTP